MPASFREVGISVFWPSAVGDQPSAKVALTAVGWAPKNHRLFLQPTVRCTNLDYLVQIR